MDLFHSYRQEKKDRKGDSYSVCDLKLFEQDNHLNFTSWFDFDYCRYGSKKHVVFEHTFSMNIKNGDIDVTYRIINNGVTEDKMFKSTTKTKRNDFKMLIELVENGFIRGEKRNGYWGVKYVRNLDLITYKVLEFLKPKFNNDFLSNKPYIDKPTTISLYDILLNFHLDRKEIKGHDNIHYDIQHNYPKKRWLQKNDNKFLPAVLDSYGIKSKYLVGELSKNEKHININSLNYLCKLFGENYIDYIKQFDWKTHCHENPPNKKIHVLKNDSEKNSLVSTIKKWHVESIRLETLVHSLNKLFSIRELLDKRNIPTKFNSKTPFQFDDIMEMWLGIKLHFARGFKVRYLMDEAFVDTIEEGILIDGSYFKPKVLLSEDDFRIEGFMMKNCMSKQFAHGSLYIYVSLQYKRKRINLQYRKGELVQSYGKANTPTPEIFIKAIEILNKRFSIFPSIEWKKEKYDYLSN